LARNLENKYVTSYPGLAGALNSGTPWAGTGTAILQSPAIRNNVVVQNIHPIMPPIAQESAAFAGSQQNQRVGNRIKPKSLRVDFIVTIRGENVNSNLLLCRMMVLTDKSLKNSNDLVYNAAIPQLGTPVDSLLFNYGNGTYGGFNGVPYDVNWRVNTNRYNVISDRVLKLQKGYGQMPAPGNVVPYAGSVTTIDGHQTYKYSINIPCPEFLKYESNTESFPSNFSPFWACGFCQPDGDGTTDYLNQYVMVNYVTHLVYEDA